MKGRCDGCWFFRVVIVVVVVYLLTNIYISVHGILKSKYRFTCAAKGDYR